MPHPVRWMGRAIAWLEGVLRRAFPRTPAGERLAGALLALLIPLAFGGGSWLLLEGLRGCFLVLPGWWRSGSPISCWPPGPSRGRAWRCVHPWRRGTWRGAREAVSRIVGRDTQQLDEAGVVKAAVETVAENTSDGVTAPLLFLALGGLPLGMVYKAVNTMDSMVGYRNERYCWFGTAAARLDDVLNWIPARLSGLLMCLAAALLPGCSGQRALRVFVRDRKSTVPPTLPTRRRPVPGPWGSGWQGTPGILEKRCPSPPSGATSGRWSVRMSPGPVY